MNIPFPVESIQQFITQFACRMPTRREFDSAAKRNLKEVLTNSTALDNSIKDLFQLFDDEVSEKSPYLFQAAKQYVVQHMTVTIPSLVIDHTSITLCHPVKLGRKMFFNAFDTNDLNKAMSRVLVEIQSVSRMNFHRAGKIFEIVAGPFPPNEKAKWLSGIFRYNLDEVVEGNLVLTPIKKLDSEVFNFQTRLSFQQPNLDAAFNIALRIDINNRELRDSLEPPQVQAVWNQADRHIEAYLKELFGESVG
jgi:hypothetical protein